MMKAVALTFLSTLLVVEAATKISVLNFGYGKAVRRSEATSAETSVDGVVSFWSALHGQSSSNIQYAGMPVVPDLFRKPDSGVVIGISGSDVDLESFPGFASLFEMEETVGFMEVKGQRCQSLLSSFSDPSEATAENFVALSVEQAFKNSLTAIKVNVDGESMAAVDNQVITLVNQLKSAAESSGKRLVVHIIVEESESQSRRRLSSSRELEDEQNQNANGENQEDDKEYNGYYGYAYVNKYGVWVTPYKTMFQIQYFNVVTWTAIGLALLLMFCFFLMVYMPLEPDTLLFGESAKFVGDD
jgi:hypothetical protein